MAIGCRSHLLGRAGCSLYSAQRARPLDPLHVPFVGSRAVAGVEQASKISGRLGSLHAVMHGRQLEALFSGRRRALRIDSVAERVLCATGRRRVTAHNHSATLQHTREVQLLDCNLQPQFTGGVRNRLLDGPPREVLPADCTCPGARVTSVGYLRVRFAVEPYSWSSNRAHLETGANMVSRTKKRALDPLLVPALLALATPP